LPTGVAGFGFGSRSLAGRYRAGRIERSAGEVSFPAEWMTIARPALGGGFAGCGTPDALAGSRAAADTSAAAAAAARTTPTTAARRRRDNRRTSSFKRSDRSTGSER